VGGGDLNAIWQEGAQRVRAGYIMQQHQAKINMNQKNMDPPSF